MAQAGARLEPATPQRAEGRPDEPPSLWQLGQTSYLTGSTLREEAQKIHGCSREDKIVIAAHFLHGFFGLGTLDLGWVPGPRLVNALRSPWTVPNLEARFDAQQELEVEREANRLATVWGSISAKPYPWSAPSSAAAASSSRGAASARKDRSRTPPCRDCKPGLKCPACTFHQYRDEGRRWDRREQEQQQRDRDWQDRERSWWGRDRRGAQQPSAEREVSPTPGCQECTWVACPECTYHHGKEREQDRKWKKERKDRSRSRGGTHAWVDRQWKKERKDRSRSRGSRSRGGGFRRY